MAIFLENNKDKFNLYIHNKKEITSEFKDYVIDENINTSWGDISLVKATLLLFKKAFEEKENKFYFVIDPVFLFNLDTIYQIIFKQDSSFIEHWNKNTNLLKQSQWMCLKRD